MTESISREEALEALLTDEKTKLDEKNETLHDQRLLLAKLRLRSKLFGNNDLSRDEAALLHSLPRMISERESDRDYIDQRIKQLEAFRDAQS